MSSVLSLIGDFLFNLAVYGVLATIIVMVLTEIVGNNIRFRVRRWKRRALKWLRNYEVNLTVTAKTSQLSVPTDNGVSTIEEMFNRENVKFSRNDTSFNFTLHKKGRAIEGELVLLPVAEDIVDSIQVRLVHPAGYRSFGNDYIDIIDIIGDIKTTVSKSFDQLLEFTTSLECSRLKGALEATGLLAKYGIESLTATKDSVRLDFSGETVVLYGKLNSELKSLVQELVAYYG